MSEEAYPKVIAHTPIIKPAASLPGCIVIREYDDEYVVHHAASDDHGNLVSFFWGHYFKKNEPDALKRAMRVFIDKSIRWHGLGYHDNGNWREE